MIMKIMSCSELERLRVCGTVFERRSKELDVGSDGAVLRSKGPEESSQ